MAMDVPGLRIACMADGIRSVHLLVEGAGEFLRVSCIMNIILTLPDWCHHCRTPNYYWPISHGSSHGLRLRNTTPASI